MIKPYRKGIVVMKPLFPHQKQQKYKKGTKELFLKDICLDDIPNHSHFKSNKNNIIY